MLVIRQVQSFHTGVNWGFPEAEAIERRLERGLPLDLRCFSGRPPPRDPDDDHVRLEGGPLPRVDVEAEVADLEVKPHLLLELGPHRDLPAKAVHCATIIITHTDVTSYNFFTFRFKFLTLDRKDGTRMSIFWQIR